MTPTAFENWQQEAINERNIRLSKEYFTISMDMMALSEIVDLNEKKVITTLDGMALVEEYDGSLSVHYTDIDTIKYEKTLRSQKMKKRNHLRLV